MAERVTVAHSRSLQYRNAVSKRSLLSVAAGFLFAGSLALAQTGAAAPSAPASVSAPQTGPTLSSPGATTQQQNRQGNGATQNQQTQNGQQQNNFDPVTGRRLTDSNSQDNKNNDQVDRTGGVAPLSEFQQLVAASTGRVLPIYGANLFGGVPSTFAPVDDMPVTPDYTLGVGDQIHVQLTGQVNLDAAYTVDRTGSIFIPQVGSLHIAGLRFSQLPDFLHTQIGRVFRNFDLTVNMGQLRSIPIFVLGQTARPGRYTIGSLSTLLNALFASGGPTGQGTLRDIQVKRDGKVIVDFDLYDLLLRGDKSHDVRLEPGDVIFIPQIGPQVAIAGSVSSQAIYELRGETNLKQLLDLAGGFTNVASNTSARLERIYEHTERSIVDLNLANAATTDLHNGDIVTISPILGRFKDAVTLRGNVANPGRYVWHPGMRLLDLIPNREALVTRQYYDKLNQLATTPTQAANGDKSGELGIRSGINSSGGGGGTGANANGAPVAAALADSGVPFGPANDVVLTAPDIDWSYAVVERQSKVDLTTVLLAFAPGKLLLEGDQSQNLELIAGDVVTIFSKADIRVPITQQTRFVRLEGEFIASGLYSVLPGETLRQLIRRVGGFTNDAYLFASQFTRESTRRLEAQRIQDYADSLDAQIASESSRIAGSSVVGTDPTTATSDARLAVARLRRLQASGRIVLSSLKPDSRGVDAVPDLALEDGDRFIVPRTPSSVNVQGQVYNPNAFLFERDKHAASYIHQAGGPDRTADKKRMFVLRADGSVYSQQYGNVMHAKIFPGDSVVIPPVLSHSNLFRNIVALTGVASTVGFNVAALLYLTR